MAGATVVGSLLVQMGLDSAQFERGSKKAQSVINTMASAFNVSAEQIKEASSRAGVSVVQFGNQVAALQGSLNPAAKALANYRQEAALLKEAYRIGAITQDQFRASLRGTIQDYNSASKGVRGANDNIATSTGNVKSGMQQLGYQISDVAAMWGSGSKPMQIFSSQAGQVVQSIALMTGSAGRFGAFMTGPWGAAITAGVIVLGTLIGKLGEAEDKMDSLRQSSKDAVDELYNSLNTVSEMTKSLDQGAKSRIEAMGLLAGLNRDIAEAENRVNLLSSAGSAGAVDAALQLARLKSQRKAAQAQLDEANSSLRTTMGLGDVRDMQAKAQEANNKAPKSAKSKGRTKTGPTMATDAEQQAELDRLNTEYLQARLQITNNEEERVGIEWDLLAKERDQRLAAIDADKTLTDEQKAARKAVIEQIYGAAAKEGETVVVGNSPAEVRLRQEQAERAISLNNDSLSRQADTLDALAEIEPNTRKRAELEQQALAAQQEIQRSLLEQQIANGQVADADQARAQLATQQNVARQKLNIENATPLQSYANDLRSSTENINDAMENIQVEALDSLTNGLANAIAGTQKLGDVFKNVAQQIIAELIKIQIQKAIVGALGNVLGGGSTLSSTTIAGAGSYDYSAISGISIAGARANGGPINAGLPYLVGERGPEIVVPGNSGQVIPNHELSDLGGGGTTNNYYGPGAEQFWGTVDQRAASVAAPMSVASGVQARSAATSDMSRRQRRRIP